MRRQFERGWRHLIAWCRVFFYGVTRGMADTIDGHREVDRQTLEVTCVCQHALARHPQRFECLDCESSQWPCAIFLSLADARRADAAPGKKWEPLP